jgi:nucleoside-diphosphate-sugar epimerase
VDALVARGARVRIVDDLSSGSLSNIQPHLQSNRVEFVHGNLLTESVRTAAVKDMNVVFHLAAIHGGRGFVELRRAESSLNFAIDALTIRTAVEARVQQFVFASSGCVYPNYRQNDVRESLYLSESDVGPPYDPDNVYGTAKLAAELTLRSYFLECGFNSVSCRLFTVFGERSRENHAIVAMIARALIRQDPFQIWGTGAQIRNWTYVGDIVRGLVLAADQIVDASAVNLGTEERTTVMEAVQQVLRVVGHSPQFQFQPSMPTGPMNRVASAERARDVLGWSPEVSFVEGLERTIRWYQNVVDLDSIAKNLPTLLVER